MDSSKDISDVNNATIMSGIWLAFSWEQRDIQADDLPMMNSIIWPLGKRLFTNYENVNVLKLNFRNHLDEYCRS